MTKKEVIEAMEGLDDDAQVMAKFVIPYTTEEMYCNLDSVDEKVAGDKWRNEIVFFCK